MPLIPPQPVGVTPGHSFWNDWIEKIRSMVNTIAITNHNDIGGLQGGTSTQRYHVTAAQANSSENATNKNIPNGYAGLNSDARTVVGVYTPDDITVNADTKGLVLKDSAGHYWRVTVNTSGTLVVTDIGTGGPSGSSGPVSPLTISLYDLEEYPSNPAATLTVGTAGTLSVSGSDSYCSSLWYSPETVGIGSSYWCKLVYVSGIHVSSGTEDTIQDLTTNRAWSWSSSATGAVSGSYTLKIYSDAGGTTEVSSTNIFVVLDKDPTGGGGGMIP